MKSLFNGFLALSLFASVTFAHADPSAIIKAVAPSIVTVKVTQKTTVGADGQSSNEESTSDSEGVIITPDGIVMISTLSYDSSMLETMILGNLPDGMKMKNIPEGFRVIEGRDVHEYPAKLVAMDSQYGLTFVKIEAPAGTVFPAISMDQPTATTIGENVFTVSRLNAGYGYAPFCTQDTIGGMVTQPSLAYILGTSSTNLGLPYFDTNGKLLGVLTMLKPLIAPNIKDMSMISASSLFKPFLVPTTSLKAVIQQAIAKASAATTTAPATK